MAALRKANAYTKRYARPFTRKSSVRSKAYIKTTPPQKVVKFHMGNYHAYMDGKYKYFIRVVSLQSVQMRDNAIESARQAVNKFLDAKFLGNYYFGVKVYPHHILRENKMFSGGSKGERVNTGMQLSYGKTIGRAALVPAGKEIFIVAIENEKAMRDTKVFLHKMKSKLPCTSRVIIEIKK